MPISSKDLSKIIKDFKKTETKEFIAERRQKREFFQKKFSQNNISNLNEGDVREIVRSLWSFEMWGNKDYVVNQILKDSVIALRNRLKNAFYGSKSIAEAFNHLIKDIHMMGPASASEILTCMYPERCGIWNEKARCGLKSLSYSEILPLDKKNITGKEYEKFCNVLIEIRKNLRNINQDIEDFLELDYFLYYLYEQSIITKKKEEKIKDFNHNEMIGLLLEIGDGLGFDVDKEYQAGPGARVDVRWSTKIANLGRIAYAFEVQRAGSRDSAILNLQKAKQADPSMQKLVIVSTEEQLDKFRNEIDALDPNFKRSVSYLTVDKVNEAYDNLKNLKEVLQIAGLMEEIKAKI